MATPTSRSLDECRSRGWTACVVEKWIPGMNVRKDVFGFGDILALDGLPGSLLIQATAAGVGARVHKIETECRAEAILWLKAGNRIAVWGWTKKKWLRKDGTPAKGLRWALRDIPITLKGPDE